MGKNSKILAQKSPIRKFELIIQQVQYVETRLKIHIIVLSESLIHRGLPGARLKIIFLHNVDNVLIRAFRLDLSSLQVWENDQMIMNLWSAKIKILTFTASFRNKYIFLKSSKIWNYSCQFCCCTKVIFDQAVGWQWILVIENFS